MCMVAQGSPTLTTEAKSRACSFSVRSSVWSAKEIRSGSCGEKKGEEDSDVGIYLAHAAFGDGRQEDRRSSPMGEGRRRPMGDGWLGIRPGEGLLKPTHRDKLLKV